MMSRREYCSSMRVSSQSAVNLESRSFSIGMRDSPGWNLAIVFTTSLTPSTIFRLTCNHMLLASSQCERTRGVNGCSCYS